MMKNSQPVLRLATLLGSTREGRFAPKIGRWFNDRVRERDDFELDALDLARLELPTVLAAEPGGAVRAFRERLDEADAFVVITPEYNHGYPAPVKNAIDLGGTEWRAKPVALVSYGGMSGGIRAAEQLRQVFVELRAAPIRETVTIHNPWLDFESGDPAARNEAARRMLDELQWWALTLRRGREERPYAA